MFVCSIKITSLELFEQFLTHFNAANLLHACLHDVAGAVAVVEHVVHRLSSAEAMTSSPNWYRIIMAALKTCANGFALS